MKSSGCEREYEIWREKDEGGGFKDYVDGIGRNDKAEERVEWK